MTDEKKPTHEAAKKVADAAKPASGLNPKPKYSGSYGGQGYGSGYGNWNYDGGTHTRRSRYHDYDAPPGYEYSHKAGGYVPVGTDYGEDPNDPLPWGEDELPLTEQAHPSSRRTHSGYRKPVGDTQPGKDWAKKASDADVKMAIPEFLRRYETAEKARFERFRTLVTHREAIEYDGQYAEISGAKLQRISDLIRQEWLGVLDAAGMAVSVEAIESIKVIVDDIIYNEAEFQPSDGSARRIIVEKG
jgi:hypothetical protein